MMADRDANMSASQYGLAQLCERRWGFTYILGMREPTTWQAELGSRTHKIHEDYGLHGVAPDLHETWRHPDAKGVYYPGAIARTMMPEGLYPPPGVGYVEKHLKLDHNGVAWQGYIDRLVITPELIGVIDFKVRQDPRKYGMDEEQLLHDTQQLMYSRLALHFVTGELMQPARPVRCSWIYGSRDANPRKARVTSITHENPGDVYALFEPRQRGAERLVQLRRAKVDPLTLTPNADACWAYRKPCPHLERCNLTTEERIGHIMAEDSVIAEIMRKAGIPAGGAAAAPPPAAPPAPPAGNDQIAALQAQLAALQGQAAPAPAPVPAAAPVAAPVAPPPAPVAERSTVAPASSDVAKALTDDDVFIDAVVRRVLVTLVQKLG